MKKQTKFHIICQSFFFLLVSGLLLLPQAVFAASTGTTPILQQNGSGCVLQDGDYVTESGWTHQYYIEVPTGLTRLRVQLFDADIGGNHDFQGGNRWNTSCVYTLYNPSGTQVATFTGNRTSGTDNNWRDFYNTTSTPIPNGHWRLVVDMRASVTTGDETNAYGIRADDGNETSAGTELNIYAYSFVPLGRMSSTLYPWVTSGCTVDYNDFDGDSTNTISYSSRTGTISGSYSGSANNAWLNAPISITNDLYSIESGLWSATNALSGSNINNFYVGNYLAADPSPTAQPQANSFRIYLPRDGGGKPSKPFVTQKISFVSGPNPPTINNTTRVRVEIVVFNPAAQAITFSSSNVVTANVPGAGVVYAGNATFSQGSITGQPGIGLTGNITWNPGIVAAGGTATFYYQVDVTPPSAIRLAVTGAPGTSGTKATYLDETGNATYTYGELCELAVTTGTNIPTLAAIHSFKAFMENGRAVVEWQTGSEDGTAGYYLTRKDKRSNEFELVSPSFLPGLQCTQGGVYRVFDDSAQYNETYEYQLLEVEAQGGLRKHEPFKVMVGDQEPNLSRMEDPNQKGLRLVPTEVRDFSHMAFAPSAKNLARLRERKMDLQTAAAGQPARSRGQAKIAVRENGLYFLDAAQIASWLGVSPQQAQTMIMSRTINLFSQGTNVQWLANQDQTGIYFYGEGIDSIYTDFNIYWLENQSGVSLNTVNGGTPAAAAANQTFQEKVHFEENHYSLTALFDDPQADFFLWDYLVGGESGKTFKILVNGAANSGTAKLTVALQGATDTAGNPDHRVRVSLNNTFIGESEWNGYRAHSFTLAFDQSLLREGENSVELTGVLGGQTPYSIFYLESFDLAYQRQYRAVNNRLLCQGDGNPVITVDGFSDLNIMVWNVTKPGQPKLVTGTTIDPTYQVSFRPTSAQSKYLVVSLPGIQAPAYAMIDQPSQLKQARNSAEYVVIAPEVMVNTVRDLADYHRQKGLAAMVVDLEDIYDEFNNGIADPHAIQKFLAYAYKNWNGKKPKFAVLTGKGTFDYKDCYGYGDNLMPPLLAKTPNGLFAADNLFGNVTGKNGVPEIAVGRLPAVTVAELRTLIDKIKVYGSGGGAWTKSIMLVADKSDAGGDFDITSNDLAKLMPGYAVAKAYHAEGDDPDATRAEIVAWWSSGASLVNYTGHAGLDYLSKDDIFNAVDVSSLSNGSKLPVVTLLTCVAGRFEIPGFNSLAEELLLERDGGAVTTLAPSGWSFNSMAASLGQELYKAVYLQGIRNIGNAWLKAATRYIAQGNDPYMLNIYNILGDPATVFK